MNTKLSYYSSEDRECIWRYKIKYHHVFFLFFFFTYSFSVFSVLLCENFAVVLIFFRTFSWLLGVLGEFGFLALSSTEQIYIIIYIFFFRNKTPPVSSANFHKSHNGTRHQEKASLGVSCLSQYQLA